MSVWLESPGLPCAVLLKVVRQGGGVVASVLGHADGGGTGWAWVEQVAPRALDRGSGPQDGMGAGLRPMGRDHRVQKLDFAPAILLTSAITAQHRFAGLLLGQE